MEDYVITDTKVYRGVLKHRDTCKLWGNGFCLNCFGQGLVRFTKRVIKELEVK